MNDPLAPPSRSPEHPSSRALEALAFEDEPVEHTGRHVEACETCRRVVDGLRAERAKFNAARPASEFVAKLRAREPRVAVLRRPVFASIVALAAAILLLIYAREKSASEVQLKGGALALALHVSRGANGPAVPLEKGDVLAAGDLLKFVVTTPADGFVLVTELDANGRFSRFVPATSWKASARAPLPGSIVLDDYVGLERITLFFSKTAIDEAAIERATLEEFARAGKKLAEMDDARLGGASVLIEKVTTR